jgi:hypothetical protein
MLNSRDVTLMPFKSAYLPHGAERMGPLAWRPLVFLAFEFRVGLSSERVLDLWLLEAEDSLARLQF